MSLVARHLIIYGRVQGVFYRDWTVETAKALGLSGWVRNLPNGTVEAHVQGETRAIERAIDKLADGPPRARVDRIEQSEAEPEALDGFTRR